MRFFPSPFLGGLTASVLLTLLLSQRVLSNDVVQAVIDPAAPPVAGPIDPHYIGFSVEVFGIHWWTNEWPTPTRPSFIALMRHLEFSPYNASHFRLFRIGGISADTSYYDPGNDTIAPPPVTHPDWNYHVTDEDIQSLDAAMRAINGKLIVDFNFRLPTNASYAVRHIRRIADLVGLSRVDSLEPGNEADDYRGNYRPSNYTYADYQCEVAYYISEIRTAVPNLPTAFFQVGSWAGRSWWNNTKALLSDPAIHPYVRRMSVHSYPETECGGHIANIRDLLSDRDSQDEAAAYVSTGLLDTVREQGLPLVMGEGNSVSCHGESGVSNTFAAALWAIDTAFNHVKVGASGFFLHHGVAEDFKLISYSAFVWLNLSADVPTVMPLYYGIRFFSEATSHNAVLLPTEIKTNNTRVKVWALLVPGPGARRELRVVLLHKDLNATANATVTLTMPAGVQTGAVTRLTAEGGGGAVFGLKYGGQTWDGTKNGEPVGERRVEMVTSARGVFTLTVSPISAVLLVAPLTQEVEGGERELRVVME